MNKELLLKISAGDEMAFTWLFKLYQSKVYTAAHAVTRSSQLAEELVQEVFMNIWMHREKLAAIEDFEAWLFIITRNEAYRSLKAIARREKLLKNIDETVLRVVADTGSGEELCAAQDYSLILDHALSALSPRQQSVFQLIHGQGLSRKEVASRLQISPESVKTHFSRALKNIRSLFPGYQTGKVSLPQH